VGGKSIPEGWGGRAVYIILFRGRKDNREEKTDTSLKSIGLTAGEKRFRIRPSKREMTFSRGMRGRHPYTKGEGRGPETGY